MTMTTETVGEMADRYDAKDFTLDALKRWKASATQKGTPNRMLATCAYSAFGIAQSKWEPGSDTESIVKDVTTGLGASRSAVSCFGVVSEYDEVRRSSQGLEPRVSPLLRTGTFELAEKRLSYVQQASKLVGAALRARAG
jgi:hypothetical protein